MDTYVFQWEKCVKYVGNVEILILLACATFLSYIQAHCHLYLVPLLFVCWFLRGLVLLKQVLTYVQKKTNTT